MLTAIVEGREPPPHTEFISQPGTEGVAHGRDDEPARCEVQGETTTSKQDGRQGLEIQATRPAAPSAVPKAWAFHSLTNALMKSRGRDAVPFSDQASQQIERDRIMNGAAATVARLCEATDPSKRTRYWVGKCSSWQLYRILRKAGRGQADRLQLWSYPCW